MDFTTVRGILGPITPGGVLVATIMGAVILALFVLLGGWRRRTPRGTPAPTTHHVLFDVELSPRAAGAIVTALVLGAASFAWSIARVQVPIQNIVGLYTMRALRTANPLILSVPAILVSGVVQETFKALAALAGLLVLRSTKAGVPLAALLGAASGIGYGGVEAAAVLSLAIAVVHTAQMPWTVLATTVIERTSAMLLHTGLAAGVMIRLQSSVRAGLLTLLGGALTHAAVNYITVPIGMDLISIAVGEALIALVSVVVFMHTVRMLKGAA